MKKYLLYIILIWSILGCQVKQERTLTGEKESLEYSFDNIDTEVINVIENKSLNTIRIEKLTSFDWTKLYIFIPYTSVDSIYSVLGFEWEAAKKTFIHQHDGHNLLVFTEGDSIVNYLKWPRNKGDFSRIQSSDYTKSSAVFRITRVRQSDQDWVFFDQR